MAEHRSPTSRRTTPTSTASRATPFAYLRDHDPVHWTEEADGGRGFWSLTKYDDVLSPAAHTDIFSSRLGIRLEDMDAEETEARRTMMEMDSPEHTSCAAWSAVPSRPQSVAEYEDAVRELAVEILDALDGHEEFNFVQRRRARTSDADAGTLLGLPDDDLEWLVGRGDALIGNTDPDFTDFVVDQSRHVGATASCPFAVPSRSSSSSTQPQALEERRLTPTHDVLSALLEPNARTATPSTTWPSRTSSRSMVAAGNDTTRYTMTGGLSRSSNAPSSSPRIPTMTSSERKQLVEEMLRWTTVTMHFRRTLTRGHRAARQEPRKRATKWCSGTSSANYDEEHFESPDEFRPDRSPNDHVAFGLHSPHLCLGAHLARLEMRVLFEEIAKRWTRVELVGEPERLRSNFIGGIEAADDSRRAALKERQVLAHFPVRRGAR